MNRWVGLSVTFDCVAMGSPSARDSNHDIFLSMPTVRQRNGLNTGVVGFVNSLTLRFLHNLSFLETP